MMKKAMGILLAAALLMVSALALGEITHPLGPGQMGYDAVVISKNVSIRPTQNANAKAVTRLNYGDHMPVMPLGNGWCECFLSETEGLTGYVLEAYILLDPPYITTEESTPVYAWQSTRAKRVGLLGRGETYPIIRMEGNWMLISLRGAAGWIVRPEGDATGTARMKTANVLKAAQNYLLSTGGWSENGKLTADELKNYYVFADYDSSSGDWLVTYYYLGSDLYQVIVNDATGDVSDAEPVNG